MKTKPRARTTTFADVRDIGLTLPDVTEGTYYGTPALMYRDQMLACMASHKSAEPHTLVVRVDFDRRDLLIADEPAMYYLTDHYVGYPSVLVRLGRFPRESLNDLLMMAWRTVSSAAEHRKRRRRARR
jgi:hypothetical protein